MARIARFIIVIAAVAAVAAAFSSNAALAQRGHPPSGHQPAHHPPAHGGHVFIGGYFYDPFYGPYPWWPRAAYPYWYYPIYDRRGIVRVNVTPEDAAVYADGFYAGVVRDFNESFEGLPLSPGGHEIVLYLEGYRTIRRLVYVAPGSTFRLRGTMERLAPGETSEPPVVAPPIPSPPEGTFTPPRTMASTSPPAKEATPQSAVWGTMSLRVQPTTAEVYVDGELWMSSDGGRYVIQMPAGKHLVEVVAPGYARFSREIRVGDGETVPLNVTLVPMTSGGDRR